MVLSRAPTHHVLTTRVRRWIIAVLCCKLLYPLKLIRGMFTFRGHSPMRLSRKSPCRRPIVNHWRHNTLLHVYSSKNILSEYAVGSTFALHVLKPCVILDCLYNISYIILSSFPPPLVSSLFLYRWPNHGGRKKVMGTCFEGLCKLGSLAKYPFIGFCLFQQDVTYWFSPIGG